MKIKDKIKNKPHMKLISDNNHTAIVSTSKFNSDIAPDGKAILIYVDDNCDGDYNKPIAIYGSHLDALMQGIA